MGEWAVTSETVGGGRVRCRDRGLRQHTHYVAICGCAPFIEVELRGGLRQHAETAGAESRNEGSRVREREGTWSGRDGELGGDGGKGEMGERGREPDHSSPIKTTPETFGAPYDESTLTVQSNG